MWGRTLIHGDKKAGFTVFWADDGLDTGPILLQRECAVESNDTVDSLYNRFLYPEGIKAMVLTRASFDGWFTFSTNTHFVSHTHSRL